MTLLLFKYALPALLGYTLYAGIAGRFNPFSIPERLEERPSWLLGIWTGVGVFTVLGIGLHMAYGMPLEDAKSLAKPGALSAAGLFAAGLITYFKYKQHVQIEIKQQLDNGDNTLATSASEAAAPAPTSGIDSETAHASEAETSIEGDLFLEPANTTDLDTNQLPAYTSIAEEISHDDIGSGPGAIISLTDEQLRRLETRSEPEHNLANEQINDRLNEKTDDSELVIAQLRKDLVTARHEVRKHVAARAKALSTANKAIAFARQTIELRARLETELAGVRDTLENRQFTIARLIQRLESEQRLSDDELSSLKGHSAMNDEHAESGFSSRNGTTNQAN